MRVTKTKPHLLFVGEDINTQHKMIAHAQRLIPCSAASKHLPASKEPQQPASCYRNMEQIVKRFGGMREDIGEYKLSVEWLGWEQTDDTWEPVKVMVEDVIRLVEDYLYTASGRNLKKKSLDLYF